MADLRVTIGSREFGLSDIGTFRLTRAASGIPLSGVITAKLYLRIHTDQHFTVGDDIVVTNYGVRILPVFRISRPGYGNGIAEITAYDTCRTLDRIFDTSGDFSEDRDYMVSSIISAVARQCEFVGADNSLRNVSTLPYSALKGKSCRRILEEISACACGMWYCSNDQVLRFQPYGIDTNFIQLTPQNCSAFRQGSEKGPVTRIIAENPLLDEPIVIGTSTGFLHDLKIKGRYIDSSTALAVLRNVGNTVYRAFFCECIRTDDFPEAFTAFEYDSQIYNAVSIVSDLTAFGVMSRVTAPNITEDENDYIGAVEYEMRERIMQEKIYGTCAVGYKGLRFEANGNKYYFDTLEEGLTSYDGGIYSKAGISDLVCTYDAADSSKLTNLTYTYCGETMSADIVWSGGNISSVEITHEEDEEEDPEWIR